MSSLRETTVELQCECGDIINADEQCERDHEGKWHCVRCITSRPEWAFDIDRARRIEAAAQAVSSAARVGAQRVWLNGRFLEMCDALHAALSEEP